MRRGCVGLLLCCWMILLTGTAQASGLHGTAAWGTGAISSQMGGTGTARPLDANTSVFRNPAGLSLQEQPTANLDFTWLRTNTHGDYVYPPALGGPWSGQSDERDYPLFTTAIAYPLQGTERLKGIPLSVGAGLAVSAGAGTDWIRVSPLDQSSLYLVFSGVVCVGYQIGNLSVGVGPRINFGLADLGYGHHLDSGLGAQLGLIYSLETVSFGFSYISAIKNDYPRVCDIDLDGELDKLTIEEPHQIYLGVSYSGMERLILNLEGRWLNYGGAAFYQDIDWRDLWGFSVGLQYSLLSWLDLRVGYLYNNNVVRQHDGFDFGGSRPFQGKQIANAVYEVWRNSCLPLYCQHHIGGGVGIRVVNGLMANVGATYDFKNTNEYVDSTGTYSVKQDLSILTIEVGLQFVF